MSDIFVQRSDGAVAAYSNIDTPAILALLADMGLSGTFITKAQYLAAASPQPVPKDTSALSTALDAAASADPKLSALIALLKAKGVI